MKIIRILLMVLSLAGMAIMTYLTYLHFSPEQGSFCNLGEGLSCDIVNKSIYSKVFSVPVSILGLLYFTMMFAISWLRYEKNTLKLALLATIAFLGPSLYLTYIEITVLENICVFCELSKAIMFMIAGILSFELGRKEVNMKFIISALILAMLSAGFTYWSHARIVPSGTYTEFAECLNNKGYVMYGSKGCSFCARTRSMFGDAFQYIEEIECDPRYPDPQVERCVAKNIERTPTWMQEDEAGTELYRFDAGLVSLQELSRVSECALPTL
jgi:uncharacterized membrane protein